MINKFSRAIAKTYQASDYLQIQHCSKKSYKFFKTTQKLAEQQMEMLDTDSTNTKKLWILKGLEKLAVKNSERGDFFNRKAESLAKKNFVYDFITLCTSKRVNAAYKKTDALFEQANASFRISNLDLRKANEDFANWIFDK